MLKVWRVMVAILLVAVGVAGQAHADIGADVKDDGRKTEGSFSTFKKGSTKKTVSRKNMVLYRGKWVPVKDLSGLIEACKRAGGTDCTDMDAWAVGGEALRPIAIRLATELTLPTPSPTFGPDPSVNEWNMLAVGFPVWLWTDGPRTMTDTASADGFTFTLTARLRSTAFAMGDGRTITCSSMTPYSNRVTAGRPSPDCGHIYQQPSLPKGKYTVTATAHWDVAWSVAGLSGTLPVTRTASSQIAIGELSALNR